MVSLHFRSTDGWSFHRFLVKVKDKWPLITFLLLNCLIQHARPQSYPEISFISKEKVVNIGDSVTILCSVQYARDYPVEFVKVNKKDPRNYLFISKGQQVNIPDSRFHVDRYTHNNTYVLTIDKVQEVDTGLYSCQIVAGLSNKISAEVWLFVRIPPVIFDNSTRHVITSTGSDITLDCYATGFPGPVIFWRREKNELLPNSNAALYKGNSLTIRNITKHDRGTYYCVADNGVIPGSRRAISVEVEFKPEIKVGRPRYGQALLHDAVLHCHVEAFPSPSIAWIKDGLQLTDNQHYQINIYSTSDEFTGTTLRVVNIEKKQYGNYTCKAFNKLSTAEAEINLFETVNVICPPACDDLYSNNISPASRVIPSSLYFIIVPLMLTISQVFHSKWV